MVYMSFRHRQYRLRGGGGGGGGDFVPGHRLARTRGFLPREALALASTVAPEGLCGMELVEVSPPYDTSDITALKGTRVIGGRSGLHGRGGQEWRP